MTVILHLNDGSAVAVKGKQIYPKKCEEKTSYNPSVANILESKTLSLLEKNAILKARHGLEIVRTEETYYYKPEVKKVVSYVPVERYQDNYYKEYGFGYWIIR